MDAPEVQDAAGAWMLDPEASEAAEGAQDEARSRVLELPAHGLRVDQALVQLAPEFSRSHLQRLLAEGRVQLDGAVVGQASRRVRAGQTLAVLLRPTAEALAYRAEDIPLPIVHEDAELLVLDKPAGWVVHPGAGNWSGTVLNALLGHDPQAARLPRAGIVHRLDKDTSGLMVVGRTLPAVTALGRAIAERSVRRRYLALAHGSGWTAARRLEAPIGRDPNLRIRMAALPGGRPAVTTIHPLAEAGGVQLLGCILGTGRTHQIRVHLAHAGHPIVGDALYGGAEAGGLERQGLHAAHLGLAHPHSGAPLHLRSQPPADFVAAWAALAGLTPARARKALEGAVAALAELPEPVPPEESGEGPSHGVN